MSAPSLESALIRILIDDQSPRRPVGAGFLVTPRHLLTCAHVVNDALGRKQNAAEQPDLPVFLDFPLLPGQPLLQAKILRWFPVRADSAVGELEDIAVLELPTDAILPAGAQPAPIEVLDHKGSFLDDPVRMCGFPAGVDDGTYANGRLQGRTAKGWVEIHHQDSNLVEAGFSGTAVWAVEENAVCGMTVSMLSRREATVAYMIPALSLLEALPAIDEFNRAANPYRGLKAFREQDARFYFGRNEAADLLRQAADRQPFTAVIGASGSGKSSLVFAGLLPILSKQGGWLTAACRPKSQPFDELAACLIPFLYEDELERIRKAKDCAAELLAGKLSLTDLLRPILSKNSGARLLLIVDQFEELFTLNPDKELVRRYLEGLLAAGQSEGFAVLVTMRADFLGAAIAYDLLAEAMNKHRPIMIPPMSGQGLREAVERPALLLHVRFEPGLAELIVQDVGNEPGSLPLLEFCLSQLWEKQQRRQITHEAYKELGGVQQALAVHADAVIKDFDEQQVRQIFLKLVRPGQGTEDTRQVAALADFQEEQRGLIRQLADRRLLVTSGGADGKEETVEVVHEALIRCWKKLRQWVDKEREFLVWREKLKMLLKQWQESSELLRGLPLDQALKWRASHENYLSEEERQFIRESEKAREKQRQRKIVAVSVGLLAVMAVAATFFLLWKDAERQKVVAEQKTVEAKKEKNKAEQQTLAANYNLAKAFEEKALTALKAAEESGYISEGYVEGHKKAILFTSAAFNREIKQEKSALELSSAGKLFAPEIFYAGLMEQTGINSYGIFSPNGEKFILYSGDGTIKLLDLPSGRELAVFKGDGSVFSPDSKILAYVANDKNFNGRIIRLWDITNNKELISFKGYMVIFSHDSKRIAYASNDKSIKIVDINSGKELALLQEFKTDVIEMSFTSEGKRLLSLSYDNIAQLWNIANGKELAVFPNIGTFSPDGKKMVSSFSRDDNTAILIDIDKSKNNIILKGQKTAFSYDSKMITSTSIFSENTYLYDTSNGKELASIKHESGFPVHAIAFSPDGKRIASVSSWNGIVRLWNIDKKEQQIVVTAVSNSAITSANSGQLNLYGTAELAFSPDGRKLTYTSSSSVQIWDIASTKELTVFKHEDMVENVAFSPDGKKLISTSFRMDDSYNTSQTIHIWDVERGNELTTLKGDTDSICSVAFSSDGKRILSVSPEKIILWDAANGKELTVFKGHHECPVAFSPDRKNIISAFDDNTLRLLNITNGQEQAVFKGHEAEVNSIAFSHDGKLLASSSGNDMLFDDFGREDGNLRLWDVANSKELAVLKGHGAAVFEAAFSPDDKTLASPSRDGTVRLWDVISGKELDVIEHGLDRVYSVAFSPDGRLLASGTGHGIVYLCNIANRKAELWDVYEGHEKEVHSVAFSPDGRFLASASLDGTVRLWDVRPYTLFLNGTKPTPLYHTFIQAVKFLWQLDVQGLEIVHKERTPADMERFGALLAPPPPGKSKFDQVLEWAEKQQEK
uniref:nSTAND1 domain-containing NTPase n=1 Tax=Candidatus Electronema sp. TaxID=2698783 RepID=UPI004056B6CE